MALVDADMGATGGERSCATGYEAAPATALVATECAACGRALLDAASLAAGMGPDCRARLLRGWKGLPEDVREEANRLIYAVAAKSMGPAVGEQVTRLRALGFDALCDRMEKRLVKVTIVLLPGETVLHVTVPFDAALNEGLSGVPGRRWASIPGGEDGEKGNLVPNVARSIRVLHEVLATHLPGRLARSPKGVFVIPSSEELHRKYAESRIALRG